MPDCRCNECAFCHYYRGAQRGIMDCDPDEYDCDVGEDDFFFTEWEYDEDGEVIECPSYQDSEYY